jgi:hypothetical protein
MLTRLPNLTLLLTGPSVLALLAFKTRSQRSLCLVPSPLQSLVLRHLGTEFVVLATNVLAHLSLIFAPLNYNRNVVFKCIYV